MSKNHTKKSKPFGISVFVTSLIVGGFLGVFLSIVMMFITWYQMGFNGANQRLVSMTSYDINIISPFNDTLISSVTQWSINQAAFLSNKILNTDLSDNVPKNIPDYISFDVYKSIHELSILTINTFLMITSKLCIFILAIPFLILCFLVGLVDGLASRAVRIAEYAKEQGSFLVRFITPVKYIISLAIAIYFAFASADSPVLYFVVGSLLIMLLTALITSLLPKNL